jgi:hypothetical protein
LIENVENPLLQSIKMTYNIGLFQAVFIVIPIAFYMLIGFLNFKKPLRNWHIGCWAILIWHCDEARNRI